jgi:DHA1 family multidrug resistance protein-like MFS transporter
VTILTAVSFTVALGYGIVAPAIPEFARQFGVSTAAAASVISAFALMRVIGALPAGHLVGRFGEHPVMLAGIVVVAASSVLAGFSQSFLQLLVLRGVGGLGSAMFSVSAQTLLLVSVPAEQRGRASGLYSGGFVLGGISGPAVGGLIATWSLRAPFLIYGGLLLVPAAIAAWTRPPAAHLRVAGARPGRALAALAGALRDRAFRAAAGAALADGFAAVGARSALVPLFVHDVLHRSALWTGLGFLAFAVLNGAMLLPGGRAADVLGRRPVIVAGCSATAAGMLLLAFLPPRCRARGDDRRHHVRARRHAGRLVPDSRRRRHHHRAGGCGLPGRHRLLQRRLRDGRRGARPRRRARAGRSGDQVGQPALTGPPSGRRPVRPAGAAAGCSARCRPRSRCRRSAGPARPGCRTGRSRPRHRPAARC